MVKILDEDMEDLIRECHRFVMLCYFYKEKTDSQETREHIGIMKNGVLQGIEYLKNSLIKEVTQNDR